jgi:hypothetical protein
MVILAHNPTLLDTNWTQKRDKPGREGAKETKGVATAGDSIHPEPICSVFLARIYSREDVGVRCCGDTVTAGDSQKWGSGPSPVLIPPKVAAASKR